jgi:hypothetical protein
MFGGGERRGNPRRQPFGRRHVLRAVRTAGLRVAKAQRPQHHALVHDRNHQRGLWRELLLEPRDGAPARRIVVVDAASQRGFPRSRHEGNRARQVVAANRVSGDEASHVASELTRAMRRADAPQRAVGRDVDEAEISETGKGFAGFSIEHSHVTSARTAAFQFECNDLRVRHQAQRASIRSATVRA